MNAIARLPGHRFLHSPGPSRVPEARSVSVTTIATGPGVDPEALRTIARERFEGQGFERSAPAPRGADR